MRVLALAWMRLVGYLASQRVLVPSLLSVALVFVAHAGGRAPAAEAYGFSAALLFGGLAWQTKVLLDTEPDLQRQIATAAVGSACREIAAGLLAAVVAALAVVVVAVSAPLLMGAVEAPGVSAAIGEGLWLHAIAVVAATGVGAVASRAVVPRAGWAAMVLVGSAIMVLVLGSRGAGPGPWLVPGLFTAIRAAEESGVALELGVTLHALAWSSGWLAAYAVLRRRRS